MAGGYIIDPASGMPAVRTPGGALVPLGMSAEDLAAAGIQAPQAPAAPDARTAELDMSQLRPRVSLIDKPADPGMPLWKSDAPPGPVAPPAEQAYTNQNMAEALGKGQAVVPPDQDAPVRFDERGDRAAVLRSTAPDTSARKGEAIDPARLAQPRPAQQPQQAGATLDPMVEAAMRFRGGGGPRKLGETGETRKYQDYAAPMNPELAQQANESLLASDKYGEELAKSLTLRHDEAYQAQQGEFAARAGQLQAQQERFDAQQRLLQDYSAKRDALAAEAAQMKTPQMEDYWGSRSTMAKMATALSITLGAAAQGLRGGPNVGLDMSNQEIERWISSQREAYERKRGEVSDADNQYGKMVQTFGNQNLAEQQLRLQAWDVRDNLMKSYAEKVGTPSALEQYNQAMLQTEAQRAALKAQASRGAAVDVEQKLSMQGGGGAGLDPLSMLKRGSEAAGYVRNISGQGQGHSVLMPDGSVAYAPDEGSASKAQGVIKANDEVQQLVGQVKRLTSEASSRTATADEKAAASVKLTTLIPKLHDAMGISGFKGPVVEMMHEMIGNPTNFIRNPNSSARLDAISQQASQNIESEKKYLRAQPVGNASAGTPQAPSAQDEDE
jgi:hypothetical protein